MFERFTDSARRVIVLAQEQARVCNHNYIGTEHILLGLLAEGEGTAAAALQSMHISLDAAREQVEQIIGRAPLAPGEHIPFTPRAKKVLNKWALREAQRLGHSYIGTGSLLLGLLDEGDSVAAQILVGLGADLDRARKVVTALIQAGSESGRPHEVNRLQDEVARLRRLLEQHGIDPDATEDDAG